MPHGGGDPLVHRVAVVLEVDQDDAKRPRWSDAQQRLGGSHRQRLDDRDAALAGVAHGGGAADRAAKEVLAVQEVPHRDSLFGREVMRPRGYPALDRRLAAYLDQLLDAVAV